MMTVRQTRVTVIAAVIERDGKVLIGKRHSHEDHYPGKWEFPGGKLKKGETHAACLAREIMEECGIVITVGALIAATTYHYPDLAVELFMYHCRTDAQAITSQAHDVLVWAAADELGEYDFLAADIGLLPTIKQYLR